MKSKESSKSRRRKALLDLVASQGYIRLADASDELDVSEQTVRRDAIALEKQGTVRRTHGGVVFMGTLDSETYQQRRHSQKAEKVKIARRIAKLIPDGASIFLDSGTTCEEISEALLERENLRIVTYSIRCATKLLGRSDFTVAIPGGFVRHIDGAIISSQDADFIDPFKFDFAVIAVSGMDENGRLSDDDVFEVKQVRAAMSKARETILALTSDKVGVTALLKLAEIDEFDHVVVHNDENPILARIVKDNKMSITYAE